MQSGCHDNNARESGERKRRKGNIALEINKRKERRSLNVIKFSIATFTLNLRKHSSCGKTSSKKKTFFAPFFLPRVGTSHMWGEQKGWHLIMRRG